MATKLELQEKIRRFYSKIDKSGECHIWTGFKDRDGYGKYAGIFETAIAHRVSYILKYGHFDNKLMVCHKCDNPSCVNTDHLFLGTALENNRDKIYKGRSKIKYSDNLIQEIRNDFKSGINVYQLSKKYKISRMYITEIVTYKKRKLPNELVTKT